MNTNWLAVFKDIRISDMLDILIMSIMIYTLLVWFIRSKAMFVLIGIFIVGAVYLIAHQFNLVLTSSVFQGFFAVILVAVIVIFQEEIKHVFERIAVWSLNRGLKKQKVKQFSRREAEILVRTLTDLARDKIGALVVLKGRDIIVRHLDDGIDLNGELSEPILKSLFDPHSDGHDGAVIIDGNQIVQFASHLPLSKDLRKVQRSGTRHAAALGLAELTDALCLVVSEEQGTISVAHKGEIDVVHDPEKLNTWLQQFYEENFPAPRQTWHGLLTKNFREKLLSVLITLVLWFVFVYENKLSYRSFSVPIEYTNLSSNLLVKDISPKSVNIFFSGRRSTFYFVNEKEVRVILNMAEERDGVSWLDVHRSNISHPDSITLENIIPGRIRMVIEKVPGPNTGDRR